MIFLSVTYGKGPDGRLRYNFGPINGENGWRRLNVLTTRARRRMEVFSSMKSVDINPVASASRGPQLLREFLHFAEHGRLESLLVDRMGRLSDDRMREVCAALAVAVDCR